MTALKQRGTRKLHKMQKLLRKKKLNTVSPRWPASGYLSKVIIDIFQ